MSDKKLGAKLPNSLIKKDNVTIFPEGAMGYLVGPTMATLANSVLANYFNTYMSNVLNINKWAGVDSLACGLCFLLGKHL